MKVLSFEWSAKYGHFLRAEANVNALTYPIPPRPAVLGLLGALLGLPKDALSTRLREVKVSVAGRAQEHFWHRVKLRKDPPEKLPREVRRGAKGGEGRPEIATLLRQEWLYKPSFQVHLAMPLEVALLEELAARLLERRFHFTPCMGLSEMLADVRFVDFAEATPLPEGEAEVVGTCPFDRVKLRSHEKLGVHLLRLPYHVSEDRVFEHRKYYLEHLGRPIPVTTQHAWSIRGQAIILS